MTTCCKICTFPLIEGEDHDVQTCKTIARAFMLENANMGDEVSRRIIDLVAWLRKQGPPPYTAREISARADRVEFLDHYVALARKDVRQ